jgi:heptosyltransferase-2
LVRALRKERFDAILYLTNSLSTALIGALAGIQRRIGYARDYRSWLLSDRVSVRSGTADARKDPCIDNYLRLIQSIGCRAVDRCSVACDTACGGRRGAGGATSAASR